MGKTEKKTAEARIAELQLQILELKAIPIIADKLSGFINELTDTVKWKLKGVRVIGTEPEQAVNGDNELLYKVGWRTYSESKLAELDEETRATAEPYYKPITESFVKELNDLWDDDKEEVLACKKLIKLLEDVKENL